MSVPGTGCTEEKRCNVFTRTCTRTCTRTRKERQSRCTFFFFGVHFFVDISIPSVRPPVRHREAMLKASPLRPCANRDPHSPHMPPPNVILMLTHGLQAGVTMCCPPPPALAVCPWSCSIFPDKYHPGQSIKDISLFLKHRMTLSLPLPHCYVMLRLSLSPISRSILFTSLHSRHATFASLAPLARLSHQAQRHWAILFFVCEAMTSITCCPVCCTTLH